MIRLQEFAQKSSAPSEPASDATALRGIICECTRDECLKSLGHQLKAIVLTGSMAREEASFAKVNESWKLFGDAEFIIVLEKNSPLPPTATLRAIRQRIEKELLQRKIDSPIELSAVRPGYFRQLPPHIFSYELKHCGQLICGDEGILRLIPDWSVEDLMLGDAWRLLCNRMVELLEFAAELSNDGRTSSASLRYKILKLYLDMATSLLVFARAYAPTYQERKKILRRLADQRTEADNYPFDLGSFADRVDECTDQKLLTQTNQLYSLDLSVQEAIRTAHSLWRWELAHLTGKSSKISDSELFSKWMRMQPFPARARGWVYVLRASGWHKSYRNWANWLRLSWRASPRHWIYLAGNTALFQMPMKESPSTRQEVGMDWESLNSLLPVRNTSAKSSERSSWENLVCDVVWNYREFVVGTRA